jgi:hypothetical protein
MNQSCRHSFVLASYWVCEKSDGIRVLFFLQTDLTSGTQAVYLVRVLPRVYTPLDAT